MKKILIVEDDDALAEGIRLTLQSTEYSIKCCEKITEAENQLQQSLFDLLLLDINLPDGSGLEFCKKVRQTSQMPIILLTARNLETDVITGFGVGADDYITKPFSLAILRARVAALLKRFDEMKPNLYQFNNLLFDFDQQKFVVNNEKIELSRTEQKLLGKFLANTNITLTRESLLNELWDVDGDFVDANALSVAVKRLRDKINGADAQLAIKTVYGVGYRLEVGKQHD